jgi:hypothetical protein
MPISMCEGPGVLVREIGVRIINVSGTGCLIESQRRMEVGTVGTLRLQFGNGEFVDDIQVGRCQAIAGAGSVYHIGIKFLWTTPRHPRSIRYAIRHYFGTTPEPGTIRVM